MESGTAGSPLKRPRSHTPDRKATDSSVCSPFSIEDVALYPYPGYDIPTSIRFSPDGNSVTYLFSEDGALNKSVFIFDIKSGKHEVFFSAPDDDELDEMNLSAEENLTREMGLGGVTHYEWVRTIPTKKRIMVSLPSGIYFQDLHGEPKLTIASTSSSPILDPHVSPDGTKLAYVRDSELHVLNLIDNVSRQVTSGADGKNITHGLADYVSKEQMGRKNGYWWSRASQLLAFTEVDSSEVPRFRIMHQGKSFVGSEAQEDHAYPFAGGPNVKVRLGVVSAAGGTVTWMDLVCGGGKDRENDEEYLARVNWMHEKALAAQVLNRSHSKLKLLKFDIKRGHRKVLLVEEHKTWINLHDCFTPLLDGLNRFHGGFVWASEKTGFRHLYLHDSNGACVRPITHGDWMVFEVLGVREATGFVYFTGALDNPLNFDLYNTNILPQGNSPQRPNNKSKQGGIHGFVVDPTFRRFIDICDSMKSLPTIYIRTLAEDVAEIKSLYEQTITIPRFRRLENEPPEMIEIKAKDGTTLHGAMYQPSTADFGPPPYRTMILVYGGPGIQHVYNSWVNVVDMKAQYLKNKGILVWEMDSRGTFGRGVEFEGAIRYKCGDIDAEDLLTGAEWLSEMNLAKAGHIGIYGCRTYCGYGGYLSAMCLAKYPEVFCCAVSDSPITSWDGCDTFYSERYMGFPAENPTGYLQSSVMHHVKKMKGKLLLLHGLIDEKVHFRHTARLVSALVAAGKTHELVIFPNGRHLRRSLADRIYAQTKIFDFIDRNL